MISHQPATETATAPLPSSTASQPLFCPLPVEPSFFSWRGHQIAHYSDGSGEPLLLIHSINAAASAFEMRGPFLGLRDDYRVHAVDLLGYGRSDRPARRYSAIDYIDIIGRGLQEVGKPTTIIASSLAAAYAIAAADRWSERVNALVLICPTGISNLARPAGNIAQFIYQILRGPFGQLLFKLLTTRSATRYFLERQAYAHPGNVTAATIAGFYDTSHQPGAIYAPICFLTGLLNCGISTIFPRLTQPILLVWGREATTTPLSNAQEFLSRNPRARLSVIDGASLLVQDEHPAQFNTIVRDFLIQTRHLRL